MCSSITFKYPKIFLHLDFAVHPPKCFAHPFIMCSIEMKLFFSLLGSCLGICCTFSSSQINNFSFPKTFFWFSDPLGLDWALWACCFNAALPNSNLCLPRNSMKVSFLNNEEKKTKYWKNHVSCVWPFLSFHFVLTSALLSIYDEMCKALRGRKIVKRLRCIEQSHPRAPHVMIFTIFTLSKATSWWGDGELFAAC